MAIILGQISVNEIRIYEVDSDPSIGDGLVAPLGSIAVLQSTAQMWRKYGILETEWTSIIYGSHYQHAESLGDTTNNSQNDYVLKLTLVTPSLPLGDYQLEWESRFSHGTNGRQVQFSLLRNTVEFDNFIQYITSSASRELFSGYQRFAAISGVQTFDIQFRPVGNGTTTLHATSLSFKRVA